MDRDEVQRLLAAVPRERTYLLPALHVAHDALGYLPAWALELISAHFGIPGVEVESVAHSYSELRLEPPPAVHVRVCTGLSCWLRGSARLLEDVRHSMGAAEQDGVGVEEMDCAFMCGVAPVVEVNGRYTGRADTASVTRLVTAVDKGQY